MKKTLVIIVISALMFACKNEKKNETDTKDAPVAIAKDTPVVVATTKDSIKEWVSKLLVTYDSLPEITKYLARVEHLTGTILKTWSDSLKGKIDKSGASAKALFLFLPRFDPIWKKNMFQKEISDRIISQIKKLLPEQIEQWRGVLVSAQQDGMDDLWVVGLVGNVDPLFSPDGYNVSVASIILKRFSIVPSKSIAILSKVLNTAKADAALDIVTGNFLFNDTGFRQQTFDEAMTELKKQLSN